MGFAVGPPPIPALPIGGGDESLGAGPSLVFGALAVGASFVVEAELSESVVEPSVAGVEGIPGATGSSDLPLSPSEAQAAASIQVAAATRDRVLMALVLRRRE
jgi:hypothetical protein